MRQIIELVWVFFKIGLFSIGGGYAIIPLIQEQVVKQYQWITQQTFTDIITISQMTPGPLAVNTSTFVGIQIAGVGGAVAATLGCIVSGVGISAGLYRFFQKHGGSHYAIEVLNGLKASSLGLIISASCTLLLLALTGEERLSAAVTPDFTAAAVFGAALFALRRWKVNPMLVIVMTGVIGAVLK